LKSRPKVAAVKKPTTGIGSQRYKIFKKLIHRPSKSIDADERQSMGNSLQYDNQFLKAPESFMRSTICGGSTITKRSGKTTREHLPLNVKSNVAALAQKLIFTK